MWKQLAVIPEETSDWEGIAELLTQILFDSIQRPLLQALRVPEERLISNSDDPLIEAIKTGKIWYSRGHFRGRFSASLSKALRRYGAVWDRKQGSFKVPQSALSPEMVTAISVSETRLKEAYRRMNEAIGKIVPPQAKDYVKMENLFDQTLFTQNAKIQKTIKGITVTPEFTPEMRRRIAAEYTNNMQLYIQEFTEKEITSLRKNVQTRMAQGYRYEDLIGEIERSYGVTKRKAKFLARQETSLMNTKFKQTRYQEAGIDTYKWRCAAGSPDHPVRPMHKMHDGKIFRWDDPPVINEKGDRKNPGQDYNCRCKAVPVVNMRGRS